ncbi:hypothetical protein AUP68_06984 [Ilyonectria robusta]
MMADVVNSAKGAATSSTYHTDHGDVAISTGRSSPPDWVSEAQGTRSCFFLFVCLELCLPGIVRRRDPFVDLAPPRMARPTIAVLAQASSTPSENFVSAWKRTALNDLVRSLNRAEIPAPARAS